MTDRSQAVTAFYKFVLYMTKILQKCTILFFDTFLKPSYEFGLNNTGMAAGQNKFSTKL